LIGYRSPPFLSAANALLALTAIIGLASGWLFRGGVALRMFDIAVVTSDGKPVSRLRAGWRGLAAWSPVIVGFVYLAPLLIRPEDPEAPPLAVALGPWVVFVAGAVWAVICPERGLQDRIAGTYLVPR
jgi:hypothetical protein